MPKNPTSAPDGQQAITSWGLGELLGEEQATTLLCETFDRVGETFASEPATGRLPAAQSASLRSTTHPALRKAILTQEEMRWNKIMRFRR